MDSQGTTLQIAKTILKKKKKIGDPTIPHFKTYYKPIIIKIVWYWHKDIWTNGVKESAQK